MQLSPLQSRLAASLAASLVVLVLYLFLFAPSAALAFEFELETPQEADLTILIESSELEVELRDVYEPEFALFDRGIIGRAPSGVTPLENNEPATLNLQPGTSACYMVQQSVIFNGTGNSRRSTESDSNATDDDDADDDDNSPLSGRDTPSRTVYLSANTCLQPNLVSPVATGPSPPQLSIYVSNSSQNGCPDPSQNLSGVQLQTFDQGAVMYSLNATGDIYISIVAPNVTQAFQGIYNFEVAASIDDYYHLYDDNDGQLLWMDSDSSSALLVTKNLTQDPSQVTQIMQEAPPYELFIENNKTPNMDGLMHSVCGLGNVAQIASKRLDDGQINNNDMIRTKMTSQGPGNWPKQQFYFQGLNSSASYTGVLVKPPNTTANAKRQGGQVGGGGVVFAATDFQTSADTNCQVITDLDFCDEVQWSAPGNDQLNNSALGQVYDNYASMMYASFETVMMQIPCEAPSTQQYSLARNCETCKAAYKQWLCTVSIPRCEDFTTQSNYSIVRNAGQPFPNGTTLPEALMQELTKTPAFNSSRNSFIDQVIAPGPYKELLPCDDVCYEVVQSCPAAIGFTCPLPHMVAFNVSYGRRSRNSSAVSCNYPGEPRTRVSAAGTTLPDRLFLLGTTGLLLALLLG